MFTYPPAPAGSSDSSSVCPRCGARFRCGMVAGDATCWCADLPPLAALPVPRDATTPAADEQASQAACFCPACLTSLTNPTS